MKSISEIIQECCVGVEYKVVTEGNSLGVIMQIGDYTITGYFYSHELNARFNLEETLSRQLNQYIQSLKQAAHVLKRGDVIREYKYGTFVESTIVTDVVTNERGQAVFVSETTDGAKINYMKHQSSLEVQGL